MRRIVCVIGNSRGSISALMVFFLFVFLGLLAIIIDIGHLHAVRNELANAADAGALAGARGLYQPDLGSNVTENIKPDIQRARQWAREAVEKNWVDKQYDQIISDADIQIGHWDVDNPDKKTAFTPTCNPESTDPANFCNAVRVVTRKENAANLPVTMGFARLFGIADVEVGAEAIAYISWVSGVEINQCILPVALPCCGADCLEIERCPEPTKFIAAKTDTAVWTTFTNHPANADTARCQLSFCGDAFKQYDPNALENCPITADGEALDYGTEINPIDGQVNTVLQALYDLFIDVVRNYDNPAYKDKFTWTTDPATGECKPGWNTAVAIVDTCPDVYASHPLVIKQVLCFTVYDVRVASGKEKVENIPKCGDGELTTYDFSDKDLTGPGYILGCVKPNDSCLMNAPPGGTSGTLTVRPVLVK
ncbi:MAG: TadG family pilus assembly protein [Deltaproteobacteria bacterium]|nr:TadG family pilus assembly protein [Desulfitobacteriaceae bacterium]MDI6855085.1 TadG family pilus assembly protein [Deltaproteobacteria bacterium]